MKLFFFAKKIMYSIITSAEIYKISIEYNSPKFVI